MDDTVTEVTAMTAQERAARKLMSEMTDLEWETAPRNRREYWMRKAQELLDVIIPPFGAKVGRPPAEEKPKHQVIDMTGMDGSLHWTEIRTRAGIIRVNVGLVNVQTSAEVVVIEVEHNQESVGRNLTPGKGDWDTDVREHITGNRTDISLTRRPG